MSFSCNSMFHSTGSSPGITLQSLFSQYFNVSDNIFPLPCQPMRCQIIGLLTNEKSIFAVFRAPCPLSSPPPLVRCYQDTEERRMSLMSANQRPGKWLSGQSEARMSRDKQEIVSTGATPLSDDEMTMHPLNPDALNCDPERHPYLSVFMPH